MIGTRPEVDTAERRLSVHKRPPEHALHRGRSCWELAKQQNRLVNELVFALVGTQKRAEFQSLQRTRMPAAAAAASRSKKRARLQRT
jgi:hypothetical protein